MAHSRYHRASTPWLLAALGSLIITVIEWLKQVVWPGISTWESHAITILLTTAIILIAARIIYRFACATITDIAAELNLSAKTVSTYRSRILEKMKMKSNAELTRYIVTNQLA